jgi:NADPH:quinone reductase-like Zn-dependent oxidoreductase
MKAVLLDKPGPPASLRIGEISIPRPGVDEALVRVCATSLTPVDYKAPPRDIRGGTIPTSWESMSQA